MPIHVYLNFDGNCREAAEYYAVVFATQPPKIMTFGESMGESDHVPEGAKNRVMHTELVIDGSVVMLSDTLPGMPFTVGNNVNMTFTSPDVKRIQDAFTKLKEGGSVAMELQETFWSKCYGMLTDRFGIHWQLSATPH